MMLLSVILNLISIIVQILVAYYTYTLFKLIKPIKAWTLAWGLFGLSMGIVGLRRIWSLGAFLDETNWLKGTCPKDIYSYIVEAILLLAVSALWIIFVYLLKNIFAKYLGPYSGDSVLEDREDTVEHREATALKREDTVGKREIDVLEREGKQKQSTYEDDLNRKIVNGK